MPNADRDRIRSNIERFRGRTERVGSTDEAGQQIAGSGLIALIIASAIGAVVGEYAKRRTFDER